MLDLAGTAALARDTQKLARRARANLPRSSSGHLAARKRIVRPIDYMRYTEFAAVLDGLTIDTGSRVLDIGSPQWFSLYLAERHPDAEFTYINIMPSEIEPFREIANAWGLRNISYQLGDVRGLKAPTRSFDHAVSISVLEHVGPEIGGDIAALRELARVLLAGLGSAVPARGRPGPEPESRG